MNADDLIPLLGKTASSAEVRKLLTDLGAKSPTLKDDAIDARVSLQDFGLALVFQPDDDESDASLQLVDVQLHRGGQNEYRAFAGSLPRGLVFADSRVSARKKLGEPVESDDELDTDAWDVDGYSLVVEYTEGQSAIGILHLQMQYEDDGEADEGDGAESSRRLV